ncbi:MAG TPA: ornithine cyclodeaminase family protein [Geminicoccus sp.]|jgi:ornithine cyclodeaminase|uniref:ornithine cyclodeaminase family protein n=1 Tax=Geminicoccus sp. TaxID=2024832 RepID=UPI002E34911E|nr:ornithine cyclodeaminase family protein [Geminicoccus sp.]HEX2525746.1 ornithine cyclodeaminase family protein [Geminicoccus sp.]
MRTFDPASVHRLLDYPSLVEALRVAHGNGAMPTTASLVMDEPAGSGDKFLSLVAWAAGDVIAAKLVGVFPGNLALPEPQPSVQGLVALFDAATGAPLAAGDGAALTFRKTAADSALGADCLARKDAATLLVVGAGGLAPHVAMAHTSVRPSIRRVLVWNRTAARAEALARDLRLPSASVEAITDLDAAVAQADIISCVTMSKAPLVRGALLRPGTHVDLIGAYLPDMRESDDDVIRRARLFVDTRKGCDGSGDLGQPIAVGLIGLDSVEADLFDLCSGRHPGRRSNDEITLFKNVGGAHLDLFTARHLMRKAEA